MSFNINTSFCQTLLRNVMRDVKEFDPTIKASEADIYIEQSHRYRCGSDRWFTFKFRDFYWEGYVDNAYDGKAQAWMAYLEKMQSNQKE